MGGKGGGGGAVRCSRSVKWRGVRRLVREERPRGLKAQTIEVHNYYTILINVSSIKMLFRKTKGQRGRHCIAIHLALKSEHCLVIHKNVSFA